MTSTNLDFSRHSYTVTLEIENRSFRPLRGPLIAVMKHILDAEDNGLGLTDLAAANADSGGTAVGATWVFDVPGGVLAPGARTGRRALRFTFEGGVPEYAEGYLTPGFLVYGRSVSGR